MDNVDGDVTAQIVTVNPVDTAVLGPYTVTYDVMDATGNAAVQATRTVNVIVLPDTTPPAITVLGDNPTSVIINTAYVDGGASALDNVDGDITAQIVTTNAVNTAVLGAYTVTYDVMDVAGNAAVQATRTVNVSAATTSTPPAASSGGGGGSNGPLMLFSLLGAFLLRRRGRGTPLA